MRSVFVAVSLCWLGAALACDAGVDAPVVGTASGALNGPPPAWSLAAPQPHARFEARYEKLHDGRVIVIGGETGFRSGVGISAVDAYDPVSGMWSALADAPVALYQFFSAVLADGRVLVWGGAGAKGQSFLYDPVADAWSSATDESPADATLTDNDARLARGLFPKGLTSPHAFEDGITLRSGQVLSAGGMYQGSPTTRAYLYTPGESPAQRGKWSQTVSMNAGRATANLVYLPKDDEVLIVGGIRPASSCCQSSATADLFTFEDDGVTRRWTRVPDMPQLRVDSGWQVYQDEHNPVNPGSRWQACAGVVAGRAVIAGGSTFGPGGFAIRRSVIAYDRTVNGWIELEPMVEHRDGCRSAVLADGGFLVVGAGHFDYWWRKTAELYQDGRWRSAGVFTSDAHLTPHAGGAVAVGAGALVLTGLRQLVPSGALIASDEAFLFGPR